MSTLHDACPLILQEINSTSKGILASSAEQPQQEHQPIPPARTLPTTPSPGSLLVPFHMEARHRQESSGDFSAPDSCQQEHHYQQQQQEQQTSACQTFFHLLKGYMGAGCLSLPWAISQLGFQWGTLAIIGISLWSSYNCWTIVKLKRYVMEQQRQQQLLHDNTEDNEDHREHCEEQQAEEFERSRTTTYYDSTTNSILVDDDDDDGASSHITTTATSITSNVTTAASTKVTYPSVGEFFYGATFETYVAACVCTQQLAICTVFISFVGENILAVLHQQQEQQQWNVPSFLTTHAGVMTMELPILIGLSLIPNLKRLSPIMVTGTILLLITFVAIGVIMLMVWPKDEADNQDHNHDWHLVDTNNEDDHHSALEFQHSWVSIPLAVSAILYSYEGINLILPVESAMAKPQQFRIPFVLAMMCVALVLVMFSILCVMAFGKVTNGSVTAFLIQKYPNDPNISWWIMVANVSVSVSVLLTYPIQLFPALELLAPSFSKLWQPQQISTGIPDQQEHDLSGFEPLPPLPEHDVPNYDDTRQVIEEDKEQLYPYYPTCTTEPTGTTPIDRKQEETMSVTFSTTSTSIYSMMLPESRTRTGDSPILRIMLVLLTFCIAVIVPNVQSLISLAGALAGSSSALLIPPLLELAWMQHLESTCNNSHTNVSLSGENSNSTTTERSPLRCSVSEDQRLNYAWLSKFKCYTLFLGGIVFFVIGTVSSLADIVQIYCNGS